MKDVPFISRMRSLCKLIILRNLSEISQFVKCTLHFLPFAFCLFCVQWFPFLFDTWLSNNWEWREGTLKLKGMLRYLKLINLCCDIMYKLCKSFILKRKYGLNSRDGHFLKRPIHKFKSWKFLMVLTTGN
jgi:hypothetical protein